MANLNYFNGKLFSERLYHFEPSGILSLNVTWWEHEVKFVEKNDDLSLSRFHVCFWIIKSRNVLIWLSVRRHFFKGTITIASFRTIIKRHNGPFEFENNVTENNVSQ